MKPKTSLTSFAAFALAAALLFSTTLSAQSLTTGEITGVVSDPSGSVLPNTKLTLHSEATGETQQANSGSNGEFRFGLLRPGPYTVTATAPGFQPTERRTNVQLGQVLTLSIALGLQAQAESVSVTEQTPLLQADNANLATTYDATALANLPAPGNDITAYAFTAPGVTVSTGGGYGNFTVFGLPGVSNLYTINGSDNMDPYLNLNNSGASNLTLGANEISEAAVVVNGYTGQYGRQAGAQVNYVTKSGTNAFHGNAAWYYNERLLNANDWFNNATGTPRPFSISNEWADSIGGPILKNKAFFFVDNEGLRYVLPAGGPVYIPTANFSNYILNNLNANNPTAVPFYNTALGLYSNSSGAGRATPVTSDVDPALGCGDLVDPVFGVSQPCARTFQSTVNNLNTEWLMTAKVDFNLSSVDRVFFRFNTDHGIQATGTDPINPAFNANSVQPAYGGQFGYTRTFGANVVNQLNLSASYYSATFGPPDLKTALATFPTTFAFGDGLFNALGGADYAYPQGRKVRQQQLIDDFSVLRGAHNFKFGINFRKNWISTYTYGPNTSGLLTFNSITDFVNGSLDNGSTYSQAFANIGAEPLSLYSLGFYVQDEWKVRPNFTVTLALRMDRNSNIHCNNGCFNEFSTPFSGVTHDVTQPYNAAIRTNLKDAFPSVEPVVFAPRIGVAYSVTPSTVLRGGFGIFSDLYQGLIADRFITNSPAVANFSTSAGTVALNDPNSVFTAVGNSNIALQNGFNSGATLANLQKAVPLGFSAPTFNTIANKLYNPKYYEWNFEIQHAFGNSLSLSANYVGNHGFDEINQTLFPNAYAPKGFQGLPTTVPDPRFGEVRELNNDGYSNYNGLVGSLQWRHGSNIQGRFNYTWGHALDTCSNGCLEPFNALSAVSVRYQISPLGVGAVNYGAADYDTRHTISANWVLTAPGNVFHDSPFRHVVGGWTLAGTVLYHSGYPFSIVNSAVRSSQLKNLTGIASEVVLADYLGTGFPSCTTPDVTCYTASQFATRTGQSDFGNVPRNSFRGPGYVDTDVNLNRTFALRERLRLTVGAYFFNVFNHPNFDLPVNNIAVGNFGRIQSTVGAPTSAYGSFQGSAVSGRVIQLQGKVSF